MNKEQLEAAISAMRAQNKTVCFVNSKGEVFISDNLAVLSENGKKDAVQKLTLEAAIDLNKKKGENIEPVKG